MVCTLVDGLRRHHGSAIAYSSSERMTKLQCSTEIRLGQRHGEGNHITVTSGQSPRSQSVLCHALFFNHIRSSFLVPASGVPSCSLPPSADCPFPMDSRWTSGVTGKPLRFGTCLSVALNSDILINVDDNDGYWGFKILC